MTTCRSCGEEKTMETTKLSEIETYELNGSTFIRCPNTKYIPEGPHGANGHWYGYYNNHTTGCPLCVEVSSWRRNQNCGPYDEQQHIGGSGLHLITKYLVSDEDVEKARQELATLLQGI